MPSPSNAPAADPRPELCIFRDLRFSKKHAIQQLANDPELT
jgi:hypothetical protein